MSVQKPCRVDLLTSFVLWSAVISLRVSDGDTAVQVAVGDDVVGSSKMLFTLRCVVKKYVFPQGIEGYDILNPHRQIFDLKYHVLLLSEWRFSRDVG